MNFDKKTVLAFILIGLVLILAQTPFYQKTIDPKGYEARLKMQEQRERDKVVSDSLTALGITPEPKSENPATRTTDDLVSSIPNNSQAIEISTPVDPTFEEKVYTVENDKVVVKFSNMGAKLIYVELKDYPGPDGENVQLIPQESNGALGVSFYTQNGDSISTSTLGFVSDSPELTVLDRDSVITLSFVHAFDEYKKIVKNFTIFKDNYDITLDLNFVNMNGVIADRQYFIEAKSGLNSTEKILKDDMQYTKAGYGSSGKVEKGFKTNGKYEKHEASIDWAAIRNKYFALAIIPQDEKGSQFATIGTEHSVENEKEKWKKFEISLTMPFRNESQSKDQFKIFIGPLDLETVKSYNVELDKFMDFGFSLIQPFSYGILYSFQFMHRFIPNYGWVLIIFSILIKILVYPLTHKSYESMQRMQSLQPKLTELKEKYAKDPQRLNQETMNLYKTEKINPMGGCLPMLLQMPLLWGLFVVFRSTIELRGQGFIFWITDLANPDTIFTLPFAIPFYGDSVNILPLFMGITMFIQQKMTITDPKQKAMVYFMPIFLTLLFNQFPSGLNLYYALFNLLTILQQKYLTPKKVVSQEIINTKRKR